MASFTEPAALGVAGVALPRRDQEGAGDASRSETARAVRGGLQLGVALLGTWTVAIVVRLLLPRLLGPQRFGQFNFADALAATFLLLIGLGVDVYIRKEIPVRPEHASDFFGGVIALRVVLALVAAAAMMLTLRADGQPRVVATTALGLAGFQFFYGLNDTQAALLHARGAVGGLALTNVVSKVLWGGGALFVVLQGGALAWIATAFLIAECTKALILALLVRKHLHLRLTLNFTATWAVLVASLPFYMTAIAQNAYTKVPVTLLTFVLHDDAEVGWYGAASSLANLALLVTPAIIWVLMPLFARAAARSPNDLAAVVRRAMEHLVSLAVPASLLLALGADVWVGAAFGAAFRPAALGLRLLAPIFVLTYVATIGAVTLMLIGRGWTVGLISWGALILDPILCCALIRPCLHRFGPGGGGAGCALALFLTEAFVTGAIIRSLGELAYDRQALAVLVRTLLIAVAVAVGDQLLHGLPGPLRLVIDGSVYLAAALPLKALPLPTMFRVIREALHHEPAVA